MLKFTLFKIPITVHWMFWLLAGFLGGGLQADSAPDWHKVLVFMLAVFSSILLHELGHALTGLKFGAGQAQIQLHGMGGVAQFGSGRLSRKQRILMTMAGPGTSILLAIIFIFVAVNMLQGSPSDSYPKFLIAYFVDVMVTINIFWSIINLFPALPLDGGQILRVALGPEKIKLTCIVSFITLALLGTLLWMKTRSLYNLMVMLFLGSYTWNLYQQIRER